jgi:hypothetical protein
MNPTTYIPARFREAVLGHVLCNYVANRIGSFPLILGIHGPPGSGKTFQCEQLMAQIGVEVFRLSAADMEHEDAGMPAKMLRETYEAAGRTKALGSVLLLNDIDVGLGDWGLQGTVNRQLLFGELMRITDDPAPPDGDGLRRVPIVMTGNDFRVMYYPLLRPGRTALFEWRPSRDETCEVVSRLFPEYDSCLHRALVEEQPEANVSFFVSLRAALLQEMVMSEIQGVANHRVVSAVKDKFREVLSLKCEASQVLERARSARVDLHLVGHLPVVPLRISEHG